MAQIHAILYLNWKRLNDLTAAFLNTLLATTAVAVLGACSSIGTSIPPSDNGLPYAAAGRSLAGAEDTDVVAEGATFQAGNGPTIGGATIRVNSGFFAGAGATSSLDGTITIFGETVEIIDGDGRLSTDEEVRLFYEPDRVGTYVAAVEAAVSDVTGGTINGGGAYVFGFETSPAVISDLGNGTITYSGNFQVYGSRGGSEVTDTEYEGALTIIADFGSSVNVTLDGELAGVGSMDLSNGSIPMSRNGFSGALNCGPGCSGSGSGISGTFYGPNAEEVGGVLSIDVNNAGGQTYDGVGTFIIVLPTSS